MLGSVRSDLMENTAQPDRANGIAENRSDARRAKEAEVASGRAWIWPVALAALAGALRLVHVYQTREVPWLRHLTGDAAGYFTWATRIAEGNWLSGESFYQAPLYPYFIAAWFTLVGPEVWVIRVAQAVGGAVAVACLHHGTTRLFGRQAGFLAGLMLAVYAPAIFFDGIIQKAGLGCLLVCVMLAVMASMAPGGTRWRRVGLGTVAGLATLTRENLLIWVPILAYWVWVRTGSDRRRGRMGGVVAFGCGFLLVVGPVALRNRVAAGDWSISTFQAGPNFYIGNHDGADGRYQPLIRGHETPAFERTDATRLAEQDLGRPLTPREVSRYWMSRGLSDIRSDPLWWVDLMARKMLMVWNRYEVSDAESLYVYRDYSTVVRLLSQMWHFGILCPLAAVGMIWTRSDWRRLWVYYALIASLACAVALFYVMARYRFPLVPLLIPFAGVGCVKVWEHARLGHWRSLMAPGVMALVVAILSNWPVHDEKRLNAMAIMNTGVALAQGGDLGGATAHFRRAVEAYPESAEANSNLAQALALRGHHEAAIPLYQAALNAAPGLLGVDYNLGVSLERVGRMDDALNHYRQAVRVDPGDQEARAAVARLQDSAR
jgi:4-amino-4-deoxy-L-arabinose transferase-like glycosyltransferase